MMKCCLNKWSLVTKEKWIMKKWCQFYNEQKCYLVKARCSNWKYIITPWAIYIKQ